MNSLAAASFRFRAVFFDSCRRSFLPKSQNAEQTMLSKAKSLRSLGRAAFQEFTSSGASPTFSNKFASFNVPLKLDCMIMPHVQIRDPETWHGRWKLRV